MKKIYHFKGDSLQPEMEASEVSYATKKLSQIKQILKNTLAMETATRIEIDFDSYRYEMSIKHWNKRKSF